MPPAPGSRPIRGADGLPAIGEEPGHPQIAYGMPTCWAPNARAMPARLSRCWRRPFGGRHADRPGAAQGRGAGHRDHLLLRGPRPRRHSAVAPTTSWRPAARWVRLRRLVTSARCASKQASSLASQPARSAHQGRHRLSQLLPLRLSRRACGGDRFPARLDFLREIRLSLDPAVECRRCWRR